MSGSDHKAPLPLLEQEEADTILLAEQLAETARGRRPARAPLGLGDLPVDRDSDRWRRVRSGCGHAADYIDLDRHADHVVLALEAFTNTNGPGRNSLDGRCAAGARREV